MFKEAAKYLGFTGNAVKEQYSYKFRAVIWTVYDFILLFVQYYLWKAVFEANNGIIYDISLKQYISYIVIGMVVSRILICFIDGIIADEIKSGNIVMNLLKPYSYLKMNFAKQLGYTIGGLINLVPVLIAAFLMIGFKNIGLIAWIQLFISLILAYLIIFAFNVFMGILAFWITNYWGLRLLKWHFFMIFSGELIAINMFFKIGENGISNIPIAVFSENFTKIFFKTLGYISYCLPFQAMGYTPTAIYTGMLHGTGNIWLHILLQFFWVLVMFGVLIFTWNKAQKRITVFGG